MGRDGYPFTKTDGVEVSNPRIRIKIQGELMRRASAILDCPVLDNSAEKRPIGQCVTSVPLSPLVSSFVELIRPCSFALWIEKEHG